MVFETSAQFYDSIYKQKNYVGEASLISTIINSRHKSVSQILDVGCGTGTHAILLAKQFSWNILAIDRSPEMIRYAKQKGSKEHLSLEFAVMPMEQISKLPNKFDVILALFHVVNYLPNSIELRNFITSSKNLLNAGGILLFDMWNGKLCTSERFKEKRISFHHHGQLWHRSTSPLFTEKQRKLQIKHSYTKGQSPKIEFLETHEISYWRSQDVIKMARDTYSHVEVFESEGGATFDENVHWSPLFIMQS